MISVKKNPKTILKKLIGKEPEIISREIIKNQIKISEVLEFIFGGLTKKEYECDFLSAIVSLPIPKKTQSLERLSYLAAVNNLVVYVTRLGEWEKGAEISDKFIDYVEENNYFPHSAACAYAKTGQKEKALAMVELAVKHNYKYLDQLEFDEDLASIQNDPRFKKAFEKPKFQEDGLDLMVNEKVGDKKVVFRLCEHVGKIKNKEIELIEGIKAKYDQIIKLAYQGILEFYKLHYKDYKKGMQTEGRDHEDILPKPSSSLKIENYLSGLEVYVKYTGKDFVGNFGLSFECTWDVECGVGVKFKKFKLEKVMLQDDSFFRAYE